MAGLFKRSIIIKIGSISKIVSIGLDNSVDSHPDTGTGIVYRDSENEIKPFDLYQIEYIDNTNESRKIKIHLLQVEIAKLEVSKQNPNEI